jgi:hypothetical protein
VEKEVQAMIDLPEEIRQATVSLGRLIKGLPKDDYLLALKELSRIERAWFSIDMMNRSAAAIQARENLNRQKTGTA